MAHDPQLLRPATLEPVFLNSRSPRAAMKSSSCPRQLEKARAQQQRPSTTKTKTKTKTKICLKRDEESLH